MTSIIVDTSVAIKWYSQEQEGDLPKARELRKRIVDGDLSLVCPEIAILELVNVLRFSKELQQDECVRSALSLVDVSSEVTSLPDIASVVDLVCRYAIASYDAAFVAIAQERNIPLITADYAHHKKSISPHIVWLSEWK